MLSLPADEWQAIIPPRGYGARCRAIEINTALPHRQGAMEATVRGQMRALLDRRDLAAILALADRDRRTLSALLPLTYEPDGLQRWRAVEALGLAAGRVADRDPEFVRGIVRRLLWSLSDESGGIGWSAPEAIGEIVANRPALFAEYAPIVLSLFDTLEEDYFRPGILWAIGRIAGRASALMRPAAGQVAACLDDANPQARGLAAWCLGRLAPPGAAEALQRLFADEGPVQIYQDGVLRATTVGQLAREAAISSAGSGPADQAPQTTPR